MYQIGLGKQLSFLVVLTFCLFAILLFPEVMGNCHQNTLGLGMNWKAVSQLQIVVVCRQFTWFRTEDTKIIDSQWHHHVWKTRTHKLYAEIVSLCKMTNERAYEFLISAVIFWVLTVHFSKYVAFCKSKSK